MRKTRWQTNIPEILSPSVWPADKRLFLCQSWYWVKCYTVKRVLLYLPQKIIACVIFCRKSPWHWPCACLTSQRSEVTGSILKLHGLSSRASTMPARRKRRIKIIRRRCSSNKSKLSIIFHEPPLCTFGFPKCCALREGQWLCVSVLWSIKCIVWVPNSCCCAFLCADSLTGGQRSKEMQGRGTKKLSSSGTCSTPVTLRYIEEHK